MNKFRCLEQDASSIRLDRVASVCRHRLLDHPALSLENLARVLPTLPENQVYHSNGRLQFGDNFDRAHIEHRPESNLQSALESLRDTDAYIMVRQPETAESFKPLLEDLKHDVELLVKEAGVPAGIDEAMLYMFIASPNSVTPFHIDRYSTLLLQFRGSKQVTVFPPWDPRVVSDDDTEQFFARSGRRPSWRPEIEPLGTTFDFAPGQALHIPFAAGHHVRNGSDDVSISLSIIFNTPETRKIINALAMNHRMRRLGMTPARVALDAPGVEGKALAWRMARSVLGRGRGTLSTS
ncbi:MAG: cupin-like domain-containing protein [Pseudoxanthomonas sp.]